MNVTYTDNRIDLDVLKEFGGLIDLHQNDIESDIKMIMEIVYNNWEILAKKNNISNKSITEMKPAFSLPIYYCEKMSK